MKPKYKHISAHERDQIAVMRSQGQSLRAIAMHLGRSPGTLSRELARNAAPINRGYYLPHKAQARAMTRRSAAVQRPRLKNAAIRHYVCRQLKRGWSPELIAGRLKQLGWRQTISPEAIYQFVYAQARELIVFLPRKHRRRLCRGYSRKYVKSRILGRVPLAQRPKAANERKVLGHWEADTLIGRQACSALGLAVERKTRYTRLKKLARKKAPEMYSMLSRSLSQYPRRMRQSITYDNGLENAQHQQTNQVLGTKSYFCTPYTSQEKGTVEHMAGLVRRFFPKRTNFDMVTRTQVRVVERWLNNRPMKCLDFLTPAEVFRQGVALRG